VADFIGNTQLNQDDGSGWEDVTGLFIGKNIVIQNVHPKHNISIHLGASAPEDTGYVLTPFKSVEAAVISKVWIKGLPSEVHISETS